MGISIVIPCYNEEQYIKACVLSILQNEFEQADIEIVVVDGGSKDATLSILHLLQKDHSNLKVLNNSKKKTPYALNIGVKNASYEYVLIAGAHANYPVGYLSTLYDLIQKPEIDVVGGMLKTEVKLKSSTSESICFALTHRFGVGNSTFRVGAEHLLEVDTVPFGLYKKEIFENVGFYNEKLIRNHDIELSKRILEKGFRIWLDPTLICTYFARETYSALAENNYSNGFWNVKTLFITKRFSSLSIRHYIPLLFILSIIVPLLGMMIYTPLAIISACSVVLYGGLLFYISMNEMKSLNPIRVFMAFVVLHFSYGIGSMMGLLSFLKRK